MPPLRARPACSSPRRNRSRRLPATTPVRAKMVGAGGTRWHGRRMAMEPSELQRAVTAGRSAGSALGLHVEGAVVVHNSNRIVVRLIPCDVLARVAPLSHQTAAELEVAVARRLAETRSPVAELDPRAEPRVYLRDDFAITLWTYYEPVAPADIASAEYAQALGRLHAGLRQAEVSAPHFTDRVAEAERLVA